MEPSAVNGRDAGEVDLEDICTTKFVPPSTRRVLKLMRLFIRRKEIKDWPY
jgi:hypothetical protein